MIANTHRPQLLRLPHLFEMQRWMVWISLKQIVVSVCYLIVRLLEVDGNAAKNEAAPGAS